MCFQNQETVQRKTTSLATRTSPLRKAKNSPAFGTGSSHKMSKDDSVSPSGKSKIPRPVCVSASEGEPVFNQSPSKACSPNGKEKPLADTDVRSPVTKRRKLSSPRFSKPVKHTSSPKKSLSNFRGNGGNTFPTRKTAPNKSSERISPTESVDIYVDPVKLNKKSNQSQSSGKPGLKVQDLNVKTPTNNSHNTRMLHMQINQSLDNVFKKPSSLSPSLGKLSKNYVPTKTTTTTVKSSNKVLTFQTSTPESRTNPPKGFTKSYAPSPINPTNNSVSDRVKGVDTPPCTPVHKEGQPSTFITPALSLRGSSNTMFKTPSPGMAKRNSGGNSSSIFKTPSPVPGSVGSVLKSTPPLCKCGRRCKRRMVQSPGQNTGRFFFTCSVRHSAMSKNGCDFFKWETSFNPSSDSLLAAKKENCASRQFTLVCHPSFKIAATNSVKRNLGVRKVSITPACSFRV